MNEAAELNGRQDASGSPEAVCHRACERQLQVGLPPKRRGPRRSSMEGNPTFEEVALNNVQQLPRLLAVSLTYLTSK